MKPHVAAAAISALKWALGLSLGYILGPILINLAGGEENTGNFVAQKLISGIALFPVLFIGIWIWGINTKKNSPANISAQTRSSPLNAPPYLSSPSPKKYSTHIKAEPSTRAINKWNYVGIGAGIFMLLFLFGFPDVHPLWASISFTQGFSQNGRTIPRKFLNFGQKKSRRGGTAGGKNSKDCTIFVKSLRLYGREK